MTNTSDPVWRTSTFSDGMQCVEVADLGDGNVAIRHSKGAEHFTSAEMDAFIKGVKDGQFDDLC